VVTVPGISGVALAFLSEVGITFVLMGTVLVVNNTPRFARYTGLFVGQLVFLFITFEAPLSGMSLNPARSFASAYISENWNAWWVYFTAPPLGMLIAAEAYVRLVGVRKVFCAKLHHENSYRCIFCEFQRRSITKE
jgi:aquaporin Z